MLEGVWAGWKSQKHVYLISKLPNNDFDSFWDNRQMLMRIRFWTTFRLDFGTILAPPWIPILVPSCTKITS